MKFATVMQDGKPVGGAIDLARGWFFALDTLLPGAGNELATAIGSLAEARPGLPTAGGVPLQQQMLTAPILRPPHNIMCIGKNYRAHAEEFAKSGFDAGSSAKDAIPDCPIVFSKPSSSISGPWSDIPLLAGLDAAVDYEAELGVVIGKAGRAIPREAAMGHVFGYTVINDVTARDLQQRHKQWFLGKGIDGFCPMGPWIVTADEMDYRDMRVMCRVNGETRQDASTRDLIFDVPTLIETISKSMTLHPGDVIATGTPEGVGIGFDPPRFLRDGDVVECEVTGIGVIRNVVRRV